MPGELSHRSVDQAGKEIVRAEKSPIKISTSVAFRAYFLAGGAASGLRVLSSSGKRSGF